MNAVRGDPFVVELAPVFQALADPTRVRVVEVLGEGPRKAGELATLTGVSAPSMSRHLRVLLEAGLVEDERPRDDARTRVFHLRPESVVGVLAWLGPMEARCAAQLG